MRRTVLAQLRHRPARYVATALAICLGSGFLAVAILFTQITQRALGDAFTADTRGADVVVTAGTGVGHHEQGSMSAADVARITAIPGVAASLVLTDEPALATLPRIGRSAVSVQPVAADPRLRWQSLTAGTWPRGTDQALLDTGTAAATGLGVGSTIRVAALDDQGRPRPARTVRVTGIADVTGNLGSAGAGPTLFAVEGAFGSGQGASRIDLVAADGNPAALHGAVTSVLRRDRIFATARTAADNRSAVVASFATLTRALGGFVLAFALLALCVAGLVITNTFAILLTQRTRELALLRCLGAGTGQVFRAVLAEAALLGVAAGTLGVGGAYGVVAAAVAIATHVGLPIAVPQVSFGLAATAWPILAAVVVTVAAAGAPARRATRVAPVAALRPQPVLIATSRRGLARIATGVVAILGGAALLAGGEVVGGSIGILVVTAGGLLAFVGLIVASPLFVPALARVVGVAVSGVARLTGRLATANVARNPARASATCSALVIGVALVSIVSVGAASGKASLLAEVRGSTPVDVTVGQGGSSFGAGESAPRPPAVPAALPARVAGVRGVTAVAVLTSASAAGRLADGTQLGGTVQGATPTALATVTRGRVARLGPSTIVLGSFFSGGTGTPADGQQLRLTVAGHTRTFTVLADPALPVGAIVDAATLAAMGGPTAPTDLWVRTGALDPGGDIDAVGAAVAGVRTAVGATATADQITRIQVAGPGEQAATFVTIIDRLVEVLVGLLAITVLIALVGIANTLSLSVLERGRENALLRALGLTRGRLRAVIAWEAVTLALVGAVLGVIGGSLLGFAGTRAVLTGATSGRVATLYRLPLGSLGGVIALAVVAGLAASVLPARRAVRTAPAVTLAED